MRPRPMSRVAVAAMLLAALTPALVQPAFAGVLSVPYFSQRDSRWANRYLGYSSTLTIGRAGCALTCVAMALKFRGANVDPDQLNTWLKNNGGFGSDGVSIVWSVAAGYNWTCWLGWDGSNTLTTPAALKWQIDNRKLVISRSNRYAEHWVILTGYYGAGASWSDFVYWDPADSSPYQHNAGDGWVVSGNATRVYRY